MSARERWLIRPYHLANAVVRGLIPFQPLLRGLKRRFVPYEDDPDNSDYCVTNGLEQLSALRETGFLVQNAEILEFGSGWLPLIPLLFRLAGARRLILTDVAKLMDEQTTARAKAVITQRLGDVAKVLRQPKDTLAAQLHAPFPYDYLVPWDAASHPARSVDFIISRAVFEHVPENRLRFFIAQFHRILRPGGAMCHVIDNSDHWQHSDRSLSRVEFLRFEEDDLIWRLAQLNDQAYQNRLRHGDYRRLITEAGFDIVQTHGDPDPKCLEDLTRLPLSSRFRSSDPRDLAVLNSLFVARKPSFATASAAQR